MASQKEFARFIAVTILCRSRVFLSCTALFDVPISVLLFGCRSTPIIRIIAGKQCGWPLDGSVYGCCGAFNKAETIKPVFFGALVKLLLKATTSLMSVRLHGTVPLSVGFLWKFVATIRLWLKWEKITRYVKTCVYLWYLTEHDQLCIFANTISWRLRDISYDVFKFEYSSVSTMRRCVVAVQEGR